MLELLLFYIKKASVTVVKYIMYCISVFVAASRSCGCQCISSCAASYRAGDIREEPDHVAASSHSSVV